MDKTKLREILASKDFWQAVYNVVLALGVLFSFVSCGTTRALVRNNADNTETSISIRTQNTNSVQIDPRIDSLSVKVKR